MTFLNVTILVGLLAVAIPIVLHMLGRREPQRVRFPAVRFLKQRVESNRRRITVRRYVLLAMRIALLAFFVLAIAQPQIHQSLVATWLGVVGLGLGGILLIGLSSWGHAQELSKSIVGGLGIVGLLLILMSGIWGVATLASGPRPLATTAAPAAVVVLIDNSVTMGLVDSDGNSSLSAATEIASYIVGRYPVESRVAIMDRTTRPAAFAIDGAAVQRSLSNIEVEQVIRPLSERIEAAVRLLRTSDMPRRNLFIVSNMAASGWPSIPSESTNSLLPLLSEEPQVAIQVVDIGIPSGHNRSLGDLQLADTTPPQDVPTAISVAVDDEFVATSRDLPAENEAVRSGIRPATVRARLFASNPGLPAERDGEVVFPDSRPVDQQSVQMDSGKGYVKLTLPPLGLGTHHGVVELVEGDRLAVDDRRFFTIQVVQPKRILIVVDRPEDQQVIAAILNLWGEDDSRREYSLDTISSSQLASTDLATYSTIGMFDPLLPAATEQTKLSEWVKQGGNLFVALGPQLNSDANSSLDELALVTEVVSWELLGNPQRIWRVPEPGTFLQIIAPGFPALRNLVSLPGGPPFNAFRVQQYWQVPVDAGFEEVIRFAGTEHMALGERTLGQGRVILLTTPMPAMLEPASRWNDLLATTLANVWPVNVILLRELFEDLSGGTSSHLNVTVGESTALPLRDQTSTKFQLFPPQGAPVPLDAVDKALVTGAPLTAGNYWLRGNANESLGFSANITPQATRLARLDPLQLDDLFGPQQYALVRDREEISLAEGKASDARPVYTWVMLAAAFLFALEQILSNNFYSSNVRKNSPVVRGPRLRDAAVSR